MPYEACNVISPPPRGPLVVTPSVDVRSRLFVSRPVFDDDLRRSFRDEDDVLRQVRVDAPRCDMQYDGIQVTSAIATTIPSRWQPLCSQAVLGAAVEWLHAAERAIFESATPSPLVVRVMDDGAFLAKKALRVDEQNMWIVVHGGCDEVCIEYILQ